LSTAIVLLTLLATPTLAQVNRAAPPITQDITVDEKLGDIIDISQPFLTSTGDTITLADLADPQKPILLNPLYYDCPILCNLVLDRVAEGIAALDWTPGKEFTIVSFSIDSTETPADAQKAMERLADLGIPLGKENGWAFLTAPAQMHTSAAQLADAIGFRYKREPRTQEIIHPAAVTFISPMPENMVSRYLYGFDFQPFQLKNAINEASVGGVGTIVEQVLFFCYSYNPDSRSYVPLAWNIMKLGGLAILLFLGIFLAIFWFREWRR
jgi:Uncharacterized protein SCO1/SenC/PrrC, involved in biogenesis of respiratory and photosynthetic systems